MSGRGGGRGGGRDSGGRGDGGRGGRGDSGGGRGGRGDSGGGRGGGGRYGGGRGDSGGGRGGFSGGRGGGGANRHMGQIGMLKDQVKRITEDQILTVIHPTEAVLRQRMVDKLAPEGLETSVIKPSLSSWRTGPVYGAVIDSASGRIRSNHFRVDMRRVVPYAVHLQRCDRKTGKPAAEESQAIDPQKSLPILLKLCSNHPEWNIGRGVGFVYDLKSIAYSTHVLRLPSANTKGEPFIHELITTDVPPLTYFVTLTLVEHVNIVPGSISEKGLSALNSSLLDFGRLELVKDNPKWFLVGSQVFPVADPIRITNNYLAHRGFAASLRVSLAGLTLVCDMTISCFLAGGDMIDVMFLASGFRTKDEFLNECKRGLNPQVISRITNIIKNCKIKAKHVNHTKKVKGLEKPPKDYKFTLENGKQVTVQQYFEETYRAKLSGGELQYPYLPSVNCGSATHPVLIPPELLLVLSGQCRNQVQSAEIASTMVRNSAILPKERLELICNEDSVVNVIRSDPTTTAFGTSNIEPTPLDVACRLLPAPKLLFADNKVVDPELSGEYYIQDKRVYKSPPASSAGKIPYGIVAVGNRRPNFDWQGMANEFYNEIEISSNNMGFALTRKIPTEFVMLGDLKKALTGKGVNFFFVILMEDNIYGEVKAATLSRDLTIMTSCVKWKSVERSPKGIHKNILFKLNKKLGGTSCVLNPLKGKFTALGRLFTKHCMLVGMDVSHPDPGSTKDSIAAIVASMDKDASAYSSYIIAQKTRQEMITGLRDAMISHFNTFKRKNNIMPSIVVIYRDGVSDGQFNEVISVEVKAVKDALEMLGIVDDSIRIIALVCQKRHKTRFNFGERVGSNNEYINICPGLVHDGIPVGTSSLPSIASANMVDFYLNSHVAIKGTNTCTKYTLLYDEVGVSVAELESLTYASTYLYCRTNKSVSYATPAYYAHWASKFGRSLTDSGSSGSDLMNISLNTPFMFFV